MCERFRDNILTLRNRPAAQASGSRGNAHERPTAPKQARERASERTSKRLPYLGQPLAAAAAVAPEGVLRALYAPINIDSTVVSGRRCASCATATAAFTVTVAATRAPSAPSGAARCLAQI